MNTFGILLGFLTIGIVGFGFFWVIFGERYLGVYWWPYFLASGIGLILLSLFVVSFWASALLGIFGASLVWGATELKEQAMRVKLGWYADHPKKIDPPLLEMIKRWPAPHL